MRLIAFSIFCITLSFASISHAAKPEIEGCETIRELGRDVYKNSKPHRACAAHSCPIDYFELFPSLLVNTRGTPVRSSASLLNANGERIGRCGKRDCDDCSTGDRYVCSGNTRTYAKKAKKTANSYTVYYKVGPTCVEIPDIGKCKGSVKGLCNQTLH